MNETQHGEYLEEIDDLRNTIVQLKNDLAELDNYIDQIIIPTCEDILEYGRVDDSRLTKRLEYIVDDTHWDEGKEEKEE